MSPCELTARSYRHDNRQAIVVKEDIRLSGRRKGRLRCVRGRRWRCAQRTVLSIKGHDDR